MKVLDLLENSSHLYLIKQQCSQFLEESKGNPIFKNLPNTYNTLHKVKIRKRKHKQFEQPFNEAFKNHPNLRERSVFVNGKQSFIAENDNDTPCYIFPIDGYKFMYSSEIQNSSEQYKFVFDSIMENFGSEQGKNIIVDVVKYTYTHKNLFEGIKSGSEIIFYNIPYYFALKCSSEQYDTVLSKLSRM